jgi:hypothetical protein
MQTKTQTAITVPFGSRMFRTGLDGYRFHPGTFRTLCLFAPAGVSVYRRGNATVLESSSLVSFSNCSSIGSTRGFEMEGKFSYKEFHNLRVIVPIKRRFVFDWRETVIVIAFAAALALGLFEAVCVVEIVSKAAGH